MSILAVSSGTNYRALFSSSWAFFIFCCNITYGPNFISFTFKLEILVSHTARVFPIDVLCRLLARVVMSASCGGRGVTRGQKWGRG